MNSIRRQHKIKFCLGSLRTRSPKITSIKVLAQNYPSQVQSLLHLSPITLFQSKKIITHSDLKHNIWADMLTSNSTKLERDGPMGKLAKIRSENETKGNTKAMF